MTNQNPNQNADDPNDTRRHLGFKLGDTVSISNRFFNDHNIKPVYLGMGVVIAKIMPTPKNLPALIIEMPVHPILLTNPDFRKLIIPIEQQSKQKHTIIIKIHPLYVEIVNYGKKAHRKPA